MTGADLAGAESLFVAFLQGDPHYLEVASVYGDGGPGAVKRALRLFIEKPELGFVWMARSGGDVVGCCVVCYAISTSRGSIVAKLDDVNVRPGHEGKGVGSKMMKSLKAELKRVGATRIDTATHFDNPGARRFYERNGFESLHEERMSCLL